MRDPSGFDLLAAFLGTLGALLLLVAAFAAAAQTHDPPIDRLIVRLADRVDAAVMAAAPAE